MVIDIGKELPWEMEMKVLSPAGNLNPIIIFDKNTDTCTMNRG